MRTTTSSPRRLHLSSCYTKPFPTFISCPAIVFPGNDTSVEPLQLLDSWDHLPPSAFHIRWDNLSVVCFHPYRPTLPFSNLFSDFTRSHTCYDYLCLARTVQRTGLLHQIIGFPACGNSFGLAQQPDCLRCPTGARRTRLKLEISALPVRSSARHHIQRLDTLPRPSTSTIPVTHHNTITLGKTHTTCVIPLKEKSNMPWSICIECLF
ncbi:hypothetical protein B0T20DRAFT_265392 [Sordaria brevicollis]|uniref:Uncharacterized protein n=1 Tax=Sordaria brevicollis TaxID=83679 RepID=A0AAE0UAB6_SORBR|nr:hypothetical protein B0T20DRAFT_265392 [Sordaria brevicollis]